MRIFKNGSHISWPWLTVSLVLFVATGYWLGQSIMEAIHTGYISIYDGDDSLVVPWMHAWAYLLAKVMIYLAMACAVIAASGKSVLWLAPLFLIPCGLILLMFSGMLSSWKGTAFLFGLCVYVAASAWINRHLGSRWTWIFSFLVIGLFLYAVA